MYVSKLPLLLVQASPFPPQQGSSGFWHLYVEGSVSSGEGWTAHYFDQQVELEGVELLMLSVSSHEHLRHSPVPNVL
jgi:hypothetical protein